VKTGDHIRELTLEMVPRAIISGRVLDEYGDPVMDANVTAIPVPPKEDLGFTPISATNDRGEFRLVVAPGKYYVKAKVWPEGSSQPAEIRTDGTVEIRYLETYYPTALAVAEAAPVEARPGLELSDVDVTLAHPTVLAIRGTVSGLHPGCTSEVRAHIARFSAGEPLFQSPDVDPAGTPGKFEFAQLLSGEYQIYAHARCTAPESDWLSSIADVTLTDSNVEDLSLVLVPGAGVTGTVEVSGKPAKLLPGESWKVTLQPIGKDTWLLRSGADTSPDGSFTVKNIFAQRYHLTVSPLPDNGFVKSIRVNGVPSPDGVLDFSGGAEGVKLKITLGLNGAHISGQVKYKDETLAPLVSVWLVPDRDDYDFQSVQGAASGADGGYSFKGVAPGRYRILAFKPMPGAISDYALWLKHVADKADVIEIKEGEELHKDLKLIGGEDADAP
jgi:hypothetical protein